MRIHHQKTTGQSRRLTVWLIAALCCTFGAHANVQRNGFSSAALLDELLPADTQLLLQRQQYSDARAKLKAGQYDDFVQLKQRLRDYPLYPYLDYEDFKHRIRQIQPEQVDQFLQRHQDSFLSGYARGVWLWELVRRKDWARFSAYYDQRKNRSLACYALWSDIKQAKVPTAQLIEQAKKKYLVSFSQPKACDPVFSWLKAKGGLNQALIWQRVALTLDKRNWKLARALSKQLNSHNLESYQAWKDIQRKPEQILDARFKKDTEQHRKLAIYATNRVLANDLVDAETLWAKLQQRYQFTQGSLDVLNRRLAIRSAQRHYADALPRLEALQGSAVNERVREWRVRAALRTQDWQGARRNLLAMTPAEQAKDAWVYWRGRAEDQIGNTHIAKLAYEELAGKRGYYSFLAAERLKRNYAFTPNPLQVEESHVRELAAQPALLRVRELLERGQTNYARVEWARALKRLDKRGKQAAAQLAHRWQWHEQAIRIAASLKHYDDLGLRFAMPYRSEVEQYAAKVGIDPNWAQAIMRRESAYATDARSGVGARGLMQLMPNTAKHVAKQQGWSWKGTKVLNKPAVNIRYGTAYLAELNSDHQQEIALATAAYNAGPHRVKKWLPKGGAQLPMDIWIDTIPFDETRKYVHAVSEYMNIFKWRSEGQPERYQQLSYYTEKTVSDSLLAVRGN